MNIVNINQKRISEFVEANINLPSRPVLNEFEQILLFSSFPWERKIDFICLFCSQAFSFWPDPGQTKWQVMGPKGWINGSEAMWQSMFNKARKNGLLFSPSYLATMQPENLEEITQGLGQIPMFEERLKIFQEIGTYFLKRGGFFHNMFEDSNGNVLQFINFLTSILCFDDQQWGIRFNKKAELAGHLLWKYNPKCWFNPEALVICTDYKIPQILRHFGILEYSPELTKKIDSQIEIPFQSKEEFEIRVATLKVGELIKREFHQRGRSDINAVHIDSLLWNIAQKEKSMKPYHRVRTIFY